MKLLLRAQLKQGGHMKKRVSALIVALGVAATPIAAKQVNKRQQKPDSSRQDNNTTKNRVANAFKRLKLKKAEKEFLKETEEEIYNALSNITNSEQEAVKQSKTQLKTVHKDTIPNVGIDLTAYLDPLTLKNSS